MKLEERVANLEKLADSLLARSETLRVLFLIALADTVKNDPNPQARYDLIRAEARRALSGVKRGDHSLKTVVYLTEEIPERLEELLNDWDYIQKNLQER